MHMHETRTDCLGLSLAACVWSAATAAGTSTPHHLIALHGWQDNAASFQALGEALAQSTPQPEEPRWQLHALDLPGHGHSSALPPSQFYNLWDYVPAVVAYIEQLDGPVSLLGHSLGGMIATLTAAARPDLIRTLSTLDMVGFAIDDDAEQVARLLSTLGAQTRPAPEHRLSATLDEAIARRARIGSPDTMAANRLLVERGAEQTDHGWRFRVDTRVRLGSVMRLNRQQMLAVCQQVQCPWQAMLGEQGLYPESRIQPWVSTLPLTRYTRWPGGHHFHMTHSVTELWSALADWTASQTD